MAAVGGRGATPQDQDLVSKKNNLGPGAWNLFRFKLCGYCASRPWRCPTPRVYCTFLLCGGNTRPSSSPPRSAFGAASLVRRCTMTGRLAATQR